MNLFILQLWKDPALFFMVAFTMLFSISLHEYMHAQTAYWFGDSTAADEGHLTLNPLKQMGLWSIVMFLLIGIAWGQVPTNYRRLKQRSKFAPSVTALAGPFTNFVLFAAAWFAFGFLATHQQFLPQSRQIAENLINFIVIFGLFNSVLWLFNLLPVPGLDGWHVLLELFPRIKSVSSETAKGIMVFLIFAMIMGIEYIFAFGKFLMKLAPAAFSI